VTKFVTKLWHKFLNAFVPRFLVLAVCFCCAMATTACVETAAPATVEPYSTDPCLVVAAGSAAPADPSAAGSAAPSPADPQ